MDVAAIANLFNVSAPYLSNAVLGSAGLFNCDRCNPPIKFWRFEARKDGGHVYFSDSCGFHNNASISAKDTQIKTCAKYV
jgi:hypothetical protein